MSSHVPISPEPEPSPIVVSQSSEAYREARKNCLRFSGLLACWAIFGKILDTKNKCGIELQTATATVPLILGALVLFFYYEMVIERRQCVITHNKFSTLNYRVTQSLALAAILSAAVRYETKSEVLKLLTGPLFSHSGVTIEDILLLGIAAFVCMTVGGIRAWKRFGWFKRTVTVISIPVSLQLILVLLGVVAGPWRYLMAAAASLTGAVLALLSQFLLSKIPIQP